MDMGEGEGAKDGWIGFRTGCRDKDWEEAG